MQNYRPGYLPRYPANRKKSGGCSWNPIVPAALSCERQALAKRLLLRLVERVEPVGERAAHPAHQRLGGRPIRREQALTAGLPQSPLAHLGRGGLGIERRDGDEGNIETGVD